MSGVVFEPGVSGCVGGWEVTVFIFARSAPETKRTASGNVG